MDTNKCWITKGEKQELQSPPNGYLKSCTAEMLRSHLLRTSQMRSVSFIGQLFSKEYD